MGVTVSFREMRIQEVQWEGGYTDKLQIQRGGGLIKVRQRRE